MWYINSLYPALSFSWRKEQGRDVEVRRLTEGEPCLVLGRFLFPDDDYEWRDGDGNARRAAVESVAGK